LTWQAWQIPRTPKENTVPKKYSNSIATVSSQDDWQAEDDLRTLMRAEEIEKDPKRLAKAQKLAKQKLLDLASVASEGPND
jgi:hypothetical protein